MDKSIDELMWFIAEEGDHQAVDGFIKRYPELRAEMVKRMNLVREVRGAKPDSQKPKFMPRDEVRQLTAPRPRFVLVAGVAASLVAASWAGYAAFTSRHTEPSSQPPKTLSRNEQPNNPRLKPGYDPNQNVVPPQPPAPKPIPAYEKLVTLTSESISLMFVLDEISRQTGVRIQLAPDMPNPDVRAFYEQMPALAVLKDLGARYGFSAFSQENDHVLIVPAVDPNAPTPTAPPEQAPGQDKPRQPSPNDSGLPAISESL